MIHMKSFGVLIFSKEWTEKAHLKGDGLRDATRGNVKVLREENGRLKELAGEQTLQIQLLKKRLNL